MLMWPKSLTQLLPCVLACWPCLPGIAPQYAVGLCMSQLHGWAHGHRRPGIGHGTALVAQARRGWPWTDAAHSRYTSCRQCLLPHHWAVQFTVQPLPLQSAPPHACWPLPCQRLNGTTTKTGDQHVAHPTALNQWCPAAVRGKASTGMPCASAGLQLWKPASPLRNCTRVVCQPASDASVASSTHQHRLPPSGSTPMCVPRG